MPLPLPLLLPRRATSSLREEAEARRDEAEEGEWARERTPGGMLFKLLVDVKEERESTEFDLEGRRSCPTHSEPVSAWRTASRVVCVIASMS